MFSIKMAGLTFGIDNRYDLVRSRCRDYITEEDRPADIYVSVTQEELRREAEEEGELYIDEDSCESVLVYKKICCALPAFDAFVMHSSVVAVDGQAYCFAAESGTGKSTHTRFWKELLGDRVTIINGDKPIYRFSGGKLLAFGTPWCGKEGWQTDTSAPLRALCLLERGEENTICPVNAFDVLEELMQHFYLPGSGQVDMPVLIGLIDRMVSSVQVCRLRCRADISAAATAAGYFGLC